MNIQSRLIRTCSIWRALEVIGDHATLLISEAMWLGEHQFDPICANTQLPRAVVAGRLKRLIEHGVVEKRALDRPDGGAGRRAGYYFTQKGLETYGVALMAVRWEMRWTDMPRALGLTLTHRKCGEQFQPLALCDACGGEVDARDMDWTEGPGLGWMKPVYSRRRTPSALGGRDNPRLFELTARVLGDRWKMLIIRSLFTGTNRYNGLLEETAMATNMLADRLNELVADRIVERRSGEDGDREAAGAYHLTEEGRDLYPVILALMQWGDRWYAAPEGPPVILYHRTCGQPFRLRVACSACHEKLAPEAVGFKTGLNSTDEENDVS